MNPDVQIIDRILDAVKKAQGESLLTAEPFGFVPSQRWRTFRRNVSNPIYGWNQNRTSKKCNITLDWHRGPKDVSLADSTAQSSRTQQNTSLRCVLRSEVADHVLHGFSNLTAGVVPAINPK